MSLTLSNTCFIITCRQLIIEAHAARQSQRGGKVVWGTVIKKSRAEPSLGATRPFPPPIPSLPSLKPARNHLEGNASKPLLTSRLPKKYSYAFFVYLKCQYLKRQVDLKRKIPVNIFKSLYYIIFILFEYNGSKILVHNNY